jgi:hypothetical protein
MNSFAREPDKRVGRLAVLVTACAALVGCRNDPYLDSHIEILNAEKRALEDQVYSLEYDYERKVAELEDAQKEIERLGGGERRRPAEPRVRNFSNSREEAEEPDTSDLPMVTPGEPFEPKIEWPQSEDLPSPNDGAAKRDAASRGEPTFGGGLQQPVSVRRRLEPADPRITHLHIDPLRTGGADFDQQPGDDGISLVVEPRNAADEFVPLAGPLSIVVLDYARRAEGDAARLGRWELDAEQVEEAMTNNEHVRGVHLRLAWSDAKPTDSKLLVAVRYTTVDGRKLESRRDIYITLPGQLSQRWTPRSSTRTADQRNDQPRPAATDGVSNGPPPVLIEAGEAEVAPAAYTTAPARRDMPERPTWRPYR